jgi:hypothetical protein
MGQTRAVKLPQSGVSVVARRDGRVCDRPANADITIAPDEPCLVLGIMIGKFTDYAKTVGETRRHIKLSRPLIAQFNAIPSAEGWRATPQIERDVESAAAHTKMKAPEHILP